jgi:crossover junction endodeoxyribonuclease RusA
VSGVVLNLPWPTSANALWRTDGQHRFKTEPYRKFKQAVADYVLEHRVRRHWTTDRLAVGLMCFAPSRVKHDIDNRVKPTLDAIVSAGVIADDSIIDLLIVARGPICKPGCIHVRIEELSGLDPALDVRQWFCTDSLVETVRLQQ